MHEALTTLRRQYWRRPHFDGSFVSLDSGSVIF